MSTNATDAVESIDLENPRAQRALTECMTVLPEGGDVYTVVGEHGRTYTVDAREGRCTCPDAEYNLEPDERCKHEIRTLVAEGRLPVPAWIDRDAVDGLLGTHVDGSPRIVATDGGTVADPGGKELADEQAASDRPADCSCSGATYETVSCFACWRANFDEPNPAAEESA